MGMRLRPPLTATPLPVQVDVIREVTSEYDYDSYAISHRMAQHADTAELKAVRTPSAHAGLQVRARRL